MRLIELGENNPYTPLIHDLLKNLTILMVIELLQFLFIRDPLLDKLFIQLVSFTLLGNIVYYLFVDKIIGAGKQCCPFPIKCSKKE